MDYIDDDGIIKLATAIIAQAVDEYNSHLNVCNYLQARIRATTDSKGIVGIILSYAIDDPLYFVKQIEKAEREGKLHV